MKNYDIIIIGFGKAGKTFAKAASKEGKKVAVIEKSKEMYGGTCINIACIPTKVLVEAGRERLTFTDAIRRKKDVVTALNSKNYHNLADDENITVIDGLARFKENKVIEVVDDGEVIETLTSDYIIINTGALPNKPGIKGIESSKHIYNSTSIMTLEKAPEKLVIIGGGYIALEFASMMTNFGSQVTILEKSDRIMPREDSEIVAEVLSDFEKAGINIELNVETGEIVDVDDRVKVITSKGEYEADAVLVAAGRHPNTRELDLEKTDIKLGDRGEISVNEKLETSVPGVYAVGDVKGGLQFTYISLDDFRILKSQIFGDKQRTMENRKEIPYSVFITPVIGRIGLTYQEALDKGYNAVENKVPVNQIPRHKINNDDRGLFKVVINKDNNQILGASLYGDKAEELINYIKIAMDNNIPYSYMRDNIFTHPTMSESFNDLMNI